MHYSASRKLRILAGIVVFLLVTAVLYLSTWGGVSWRQMVEPIFAKGATAAAPYIFPTEHFIFNQSSPPTWINASVPSNYPLHIRMAIIARVDAFERRQSLRDTILRGLPQDLIKVDYKFVIGREHWPSPSSDPKGVDALVEKEEAKHGDLLVLPMVDSAYHMSEKRYRALQWAGDAPNSPSTYDWFLTIDSDTFIRLPALVRRLAADPRTKSLKPREEPVMIGRMFGHKVFYDYTVPDVITGPGEIDYTAPENTEKRDDEFEGPWYPYPGGIGYLLSSDLANTLLHTTPRLAHHNPYPSDDVIIGSWVASLTLLFQQHTWLATVINGSRVDGPDDTRIPVVAKPIIPKPVDTKIIDDIEGWHDFWERGNEEKNWRRIGWDSVCVHRVHIDEMRALRKVAEIKGEWDLEPLP